ncbi:hypothetical protein BDN72DRAFT_830475 [Pluteus cervinus]|uniref:Uncharacterized protein n=1 Tax=Pluteus cervinus TaxID=181527 RepID=A0ACD3BHE5_9AGAR|nr:hypothetical protein BDN72DRAFT_830475 [Pluteus cervinus]
MTSGFHHFRLGELALNQPLPPHLANAQASSSTTAPPNPDQPSASHFPGSIDATTTTFASNPLQGPSSSSLSANAKQPYGSGDADDGYTLVFTNIDAFNAWRLGEEERQMVEFVKGDTHGSKAVPPRFKDHTKLVCARHSRSGRKKYVKKHPERVRKVPSRKIEGNGCPASISYKTYFDTEEVRACYVGTHSHEIGPANLPYTRRGRRAAVQQEKDRSRRHGRTVEAEGHIASSASAPPNGSSAPTPAPANQYPAFPVLAQATQPPPFQPARMSPDAFPNMYPYPQAPHAAPHPPMHPGLLHDRWENMATLFNAIRESARTFEYPFVSVTALESVLIRLYLETPVGLGAGANPMIGPVTPNGLAQPARPPPPPPQTNPRPAENTPNANEIGGNPVDEDDTSSGDDSS